ncbi:MAG: Asp23/Gls24 family envelope stress response protein [Candidatus Omnitrophica bacterium]|nr:Asp23/Gls24 family envelope stress response protein [Candidatus Omnitrophota bacterium]
MANGEEKKIGSVKIEDEVLGAIASITAKKILGVHKIATSFVGGIMQLIKKVPDAGVKVVVREGEVNLELGLIVDYGINIPEITWKVQKTIKEEIEKASGLKVVKIDVFVEGVYYPEEEKK